MNNSIYFTKILKPLFTVAVIAGMATTANAQQSVSNPLAQSGYYHMGLGDFEIIALSDGTIPQELDKLLTNTTPQEINKLVANNYQQSTVEVSVNAYLIKTKDRLILVDAGTAELYGPTLGHLSESIKRAGYSPEQVDVVLITHIHTDHTGGLMDGNRLVFPNATVYISKVEADFWLSPENYKKAAEGMKKYFVEATTKVGPYMNAGKVKTYTYGHELFPGITPIASPGHTPGHSFYAVESKGQKIVFWGDIIHSSAVQFPDPAVTIVYDIDPKAAAASRKKAFAEAAKEGYWVAGDHLSFPGIGHVRTEKDGNGYRWVPINYSTYSLGQ
ncbi:MBL fold metallo-hydrolase [Pedobacter sp. L105]|uniref:MBL fold metallo-hydrolase n=1 Tax=Pedobacter sp. L105 TaxID=1641871 RepID=UPI0015754567|nr:MBL fold metallo-hydrolase [Pedobacter sp. L105]